MKVKIITTARAIIFNEKQELLLVQNTINNIWFTPGGWLEGFETLEETCIRETYEETGLQINPLKLIKIDYFKLTAEENLKWSENINKIEHYFLCEITNGEISTDVNNKNLWEDEDAGNTEFIKFFSKDEVSTANIAPSWLKDFKN